MKRILSPKPSVVLFDMDGVITDSIEWWFSALRKVFKEFFRENPSKNEFNDLLHETTTAIIKKMAKKYKPSPELINKLSEQIDNCFESEMIPKLQSMPGADLVIGELFKRGYRLGVVTNGAEGTAKKMIAHLGFLKYLEIVIGCNGCKPKPDPELLLKALKFFNVTEDKVIYIGDSHSDLVASEKAGIRFIYKETRVISEMTGYNNFRIAHLSELLKLLK